MLGKSRQRLGVRAVLCRFFPVPWVFLERVKSSVPRRTNAAHVSLFPPCSIHCNPGKQPYLPKQNRKRSAMQPPQDRKRDERRHACPRQPRGPFEFACSVIKYGARDNQ
jgi:5-methylcytosine-specific restriction endonuclease McrA